MDTLPEARRQILRHLKDTGGSPIAEASEHLGISYEATRQQLVQLEKDGLVERSLQRSGDGSVGRPAATFTLSERGEDLFPKAYDALAVEMIDAIANDLGPDALRSVLRSLVDDRVRRWQPRLQGISLEDKLHALRDLYARGDEFVRVEQGEHGPVLIERNCPFLNVARRRPALCSVTVSTLQRLLGHRVERVERFQAGDGRCVFQVRLDQPLAEPPKFKYEGEDSAQD